MKKQMKALRSFRYATRMLQAEDEFEASRQDARVLSAIGRAAEIETNPVKAEPEPEPEIETDDTDEAVKPRRGRKAKSAD